MESCGVYAKVVVFCWARLNFRTLNWTRSGLGCTGPDLGTAELQFGHDWHADDLEVEKTPQSCLHIVHPSFAFSCAAYQHVELPYIAKREQFRPT